MDTDELFEEFERFEFEGATKLTPREYAKLRGMAPQLVYYYIRQGVVTVERCVCGRKVVDVQGTDEALASRKSSRGKEVQAN